MSADQDDSHSLGQEFAVAGPEVVEIETKTSLTMRGSLREVAQQLGISDDPKPYSVPTLSAIEQAEEDIPRALCGLVDDWIDLIYDTLRGVDAPPSYMVTSDQLIEALASLDWNRDIATRAIHHGVGSGRLHAGNIFVGETHFLNGKVVRFVTVTPTPLLSLVVWPTQRLLNSKVAKTLKDLLKKKVGPSEEGRRRRYSAKEDAQIAEDWEMFKRKSKTKRPTYAEFVESRGKDEKAKDIDRALDRVRHPKKMDQKANRKDRRKSRQ